MNCCFVDFPHELMELLQLSVHSYTSIINLLRAFTEFLISFSAICRPVRANILRCIYRLSYLETIELLVGDIVLLLSQM
jgi:hypothetical protein